MYMQGTEFELARCSYCNKESKINYLSSEEYGIHYENDYLFSIPEGWFIQTGGDYCGGRWMYLFCSSECAKKEKNRYDKTS